MIWKLIIVSALIMLSLGSILHEQKITPEQMVNVSEKISYDNLNLSFDRMEDDANNTFFVRAFYKYADFIGYVFIEGSKTALNYGYRNPQYNFELAWKLMFVAIFAMLIKPLIYLIFFIWFGVSAFIKWIKTKSFPNKIPKTSEKRKN